MKHAFIGVVAGLVLMIGAGPSMGQDQSTNVVANHTKWTVFLEPDPKQCWVASTVDTNDASVSRATRDGRVVSVRRGPTLLLVSYWPNLERMGEVSFTGGYPFADGSTVTLRIGDASFELFTEGEMAWAASPQDDQRIITAMKRGADAVLTARSARGTQTQDTFSLIGFTAAVEDAEARCSN